MPLVARIGDAIQTSSETTVEWSIRDLFSLSDEVDDYYDSPVFSFADSRWYLGLYPNGQTCCSSTGSVDLFLSRDDSGERKTIEYTLGIKCSDGVEGKREVKREFSKANKGFGPSKFYSRSQLQNQASRLMPDNVLVITCHLKCCDPIAARVSLSNRVWKVKNNMKTILEGEKRTDFTLKLGDREWPVHKVILESRCQYFENMFRHDWVKNTVAEVKFDGIEEDALDSVLQFIYTGEVEGMSVEEVCDIYIVAHAFLLEDLKALCEQYVRENMCVEIVCEVLVIADTYGEKDLKERAIEYCIQEMDNIFESEEWKELEKNNWSTALTLTKEISKRLKKRMKE